MEWVSLVEDKAMKECWCSQNDSRLEGRDDRRDTRVSRFELRNSVDIQRKIVIVEYGQELMESVCLISAFIRRLCLLI